MADHNKEPLFPPFNGTSDAWLRWKEDLFAALVAHTDKSGSSLYNHIMDTDMGGGDPAAPAMPAIGAAADLRDMLRLRAARASKSFGIIISHIGDRDLHRTLIANYMGNGRAAFVYLQQTYERPMVQSEIDELDILWKAASIPGNVGSADSLPAWPFLPPQVPTLRCDGALR